MVHHDAISYAGYLIDHHWPREPYISLEKLSVEQYENCFRKAGIDHAVVYCKDHWGTCYYPTQLGMSHPAISFDLVGEVGEMLHRIGAEFTAYYSVGFDEHAARNNPQWVARDPQGQMLRHPKLAPRPRWRRLCLETDYMEFMHEHLAEIFQRYDADSVFLDILGHPHGTYWGAYLCYCDNCQRVFSKRYGYEIPHDPQQMRQHAFDIEDYKAHLDLKWFNSIRTAIKAARPQIPICVNSSAHFRQPLRDLIDHHFTEPFWGHWTSAIYCRGVGRGKFPQGGAQVNSEIYDPSPRDMYQVFAAKHWANGIRPLLYSPSQRPDGRLVTEEFNRLSAGYGELNNLRKLMTDRSTIKCVGVLYHEKTCVDLPDFPYGEDHTRSVKIIEFDQGKPDTSHRSMVAAGINLAAYAQVPVDVITEQDLDIHCLSNYQLLLIGGASRLDEKQASQITRFVESGGSIILSGDTSLRHGDGTFRSDFLLADAMGVHFDGLDDRFMTNPSGSYLARQPHPVWNQLPETDLPLPPPRYNIKLAGAKVLGTHIDPCAVHEDERWTSWWSPAPASLALLQDDPKPPLVTHHKYGNGHVVYFAANPFTDAMRWLGHGISNLIDWLLDPPAIRIRTDTPGSLGSTFWRRNHDGQVVIHLVNLGIEKLDGEVLAIPGITIEVSHQFGKILRASIAYPNTMELKVTDNPAMQLISVPAVEIHTILTLDLQD